MHVENGNGLGLQPERKMVFVLVVVVLVVVFIVVDVSVTNVVGFASPMAIRALLMALAMTAKPTGSGSLCSVTSEPNGANNEPSSGAADPRVPKLVGKSKSSFLNAIPGLSVGSTL